VVIQLNVTVRDIDAVGEIMAIAVENGANSVNNIQFSIADQSELVAQARSMALADARDRAGQIADEIGVSIVAPVRIDEFGSGGPVPVAQSAYGIGGGGLDTAFPINTGSLSVSVNIGVTYSFE
jgi:uncharacterized protein YggE